MLWIVFAICWLATVWYYRTRPIPKPVIIGIPDAEHKRMFWLAKPEKTRWDEIKEKLPPFLWGIVMGGGIMFVVVVG